MKGQSYRFIALLLSIALTVVSGIARAEDPCVKGLALLDKTLLETLNHVADLLVSVQTADPETGIGIQMMDEAKKVLDTLEKSISDEAVRSAAKEYLKIKTAGNGEEAERNRARLLEQEKTTRENEFWDNAKFVPIKHLNGLYPSDSAYAMDGTFVNFEPGTLDGDNSFKSVLQIGTIGGTHRSISYNPAFKNVIGVHLSAERRKVFIATKTMLFSMPMPEKITDSPPEGFRAIFSLYAGEGVTPDRAKLEKAFFDQGVSRPGHYSEVEEIFKNPQMASNETVFAAQWSNNIITYNLKTKSFQRMKLPKLHMQEIRSENWALSPDGNYIAFANLKPNSVDKKAKIHILNTMTGNEITSIPFASVTVAFSSDSRWILANDDEKRLVMHNFLRDDLFPDRVFTWGPNLIDTNPQGFKQVAISPDGHHILARGRTVIGIWDINSGELRQRISHGYIAGLEPLNLKSFFFTNNGRALITGDEKGHTQYWNLQF